MKFKSLTLATAALVSLAGVAYGQGYFPNTNPGTSTVSQVHATDKIVILPYGNPSAPNQLATVSQILGGSTNVDGLPGAPFNLLGFKNSDGTTLAASASSGKFGLSITAGTSEFLVTEAANSNTKTDVASYEVVLGPSYVPGSNITVTANCQYVLGSGTIGTHTLAAAAYLVSSAGTQGSTLIATSAQTVPAAAGNVAFTITGAGLTAGSRLFLTFTMVVQDTGSSNITGQLNSVTLN